MPGVGMAGEASIDELQGQYSAAGVTSGLISLGLFGLD